MDENDMSGFHHTSIKPHKHENGPSNKQGLFNIIIYIIRNYHSNATVAGGFDEKKWYFEWIDYWKYFLKGYASLKIKTLSKNLVH